VETGEGDILIILQQTHGKMDDIEDVDRQSAPTRKSLLVILFTTDSLPPTRTPHSAGAPLPPPEFFLGVTSIKCPMRGTDRQTDRPYFCHREEIHHSYIVVVCVCHV